MSGMRILSTYIAMSVALAVATLPLHGARAAELQLPDVNKQLKESSAELQEQLGKLDAVINTALLKLREVGSLDPEPAREALDEVFSGFKQQVVVVLDKVGPNSDLVDAIHRAKIAATRLLGWYRRQPADYPGRDATLAQLEAQLQRFDEMSRAIEEQQAEAYRALTEVAQRYSWFKQQEKVVQIGIAVTALESVANEMLQLSNRLKDVANKITPEQASGAREQG